MTTFCAEEDFNDVPCFHFSVSVHSLCLSKLTQRMSGYIELPFKSVSKPVQRSDSDYGALLLVNVQNRQSLYLNHHVLLCSLQIPFSINGCSGYVICSFAFQQYFLKDKSDFEIHQSHSTAGQSLTKVSFALKQVETFLNFGVASFKLSECLLRLV